MEFSSNDGGGKCFAKENIDALSNVEPEYNLDRTRFLVPILIWGPNNQIRGFMETIFLAIKES